jgi:hypothetical protein
MEIKPMIIIDKSGLRITSDGFKALHSYAQHYIRNCRSKLEEYHTELVKTRGMIPPEDTPEGALVFDAQHEINRAEEFVRQVQQAERGANRMFQWHFEKEADVYRKTRIQRGIAKVEDDPTLYAAVLNAMEMLHQENQFFSREKFINYINN